ncbi:hypothetical protein QBC44DRAFT_388886 [Cladorrhinum sp. PSN332]|nr:hypothetical protein QBC44DRAFT_388886 [Cladorrhinum sp. PSN332]
MDLLWTGRDFTNRQYLDFEYVDQENQSWPPTTVAHFCPGQSHDKYEEDQHSRILKTPGEWNECFFPRQSQTELRGEKDTAALRKLSVSMAVFRRITGVFHIHQALQIIIQRGQPFICQFKSSETTSGNCTSQSLLFSPPSSTLNINHAAASLIRSNNTFSNDMALSLTYFHGTRTTKRLYASFFGLVPKSIEFIQNRLQFGPGQAVLAPQTLIAAFLQLEREHRFADVSAYDIRMFNLVGNYSVQTERSTAYAWANEDDPRELSGGHGAQTTAETRAVALIDMGEYLARLDGEYMDKVRKCGSILAMASMTFQMETSGNARREADKVKILAIVTMVFLPATFLSTLFAMGMFEWRPEPPSENPSPTPGDSGGNDDDDDGIVSVWFWKLYVPLSVGLTMFILALYHWLKPFLKWFRKRRAPNGYNRGTPA